ncbi:MAG: transcriptional regulator [Deltaproteobacteria bacterium SG8_13]|nr:MAG: transcriptional regulator [Deltaproteobacteria bacterium SG8_13]
MTDPKQKRILIIEDDAHIAEGLELNLVLQGHAVVCASDGPTGLQKWRAFKPHLIVLDIMLPGIDGLSILQAVRLEDERLPILILSAKAASDDIIKGLSYGVDDYLAKPFHLEEFLLRANRLLKRSDWGSENDRSEVAAKRPYAFGENRIDFLTHSAQCRGGTISLTDQEIRLLKLFIAHAGKPLSRAKLLEVGWGYTRSVSSRTVDNFIVRLRKYFEDDPKNPRYFKSIRSVGYIFTPDRSE